MISDPLCTGLSMADTGVLCDNDMQNLLWRNNACAGSSKDKKVVQRVVNIRYMVSIFLRFKIQDIFEGAHGNLYDS